MFKLSELFTSIQGEVQWVGRYSVFVRFAGCNLNCLFCDTPQKTKIDMEIDVPRLLSYLKEAQAQHVVITGGEPLLNIAEIDYLLSELPEEVSVEIETNGTLLERVPNKWVGKVYFNISPKVHYRELYTSLPPDWPHTVYKFPVDETNLQETKSFIMHHQIPKKIVYFMPISKTYTEYVLNAPIVLEEALSWRVNFSPRLQLIQAVK